MIMGLSGGFRGCFLTNPEIPEYPAKDGTCGAPTYNRNWGNALLVYAHKRTNEYGDGGDMLDDDSGVCDQRPEIVGTQSRIALEVGEEGRRVGVVVRICSHCQSWTVENMQANDSLQSFCLTHSSFFHTPLPLRLPLRPLSLPRLRRVGAIGLIARPSVTPEALSKAPYWPMGSCLLGGEWA